MTMNAISQPQNFAMIGIVSGAASAPTEEPELKIEVANARSFLGKYSAVTFTAAGKLPASPRARNARHPMNSHTDTEDTVSAKALAMRNAPYPHAACRHAASDHTKIAHR